MTDKAWGQKLWDYRKSLGMSRKQFAQNLGINEGTLRSYETQQRKPGLDRYVQINDIIQGQGKQEGDDYMNELLATKNKLIDSLEREKELMSKLLAATSRTSKHPNESRFGEISPDITFGFDIQLDWKNIRDIKVRYHRDNHHIKMMASKLGYSTNEMEDLLMIDELVNYKEHNIHQLRSEEQRDRMLDIVKSYVSSFRKVRLTTSSISAEIPVDYNTKSGVTLHSLVEYKVNWVKGTGVAKIRWSQTTS